MIWQPPFLKISFKFVSLSSLLTDIRLKLKVGTTRMSFNTIPSAILVIPRCVTADLVLLGSVTDILCTSTIPWRNSVEYVFWYVAPISITQEPDLLCSTITPAATTCAEWRFSLFELWIKLRIWSYSCWDNVYLASHVVGKSHTLYTPVALATLALCSLVFLWLLDFTVEPGGQPWIL